MIPVLSETGPWIVNISYRLRTLPFFWALSLRAGPWGLQRLHCLPSLSSWKASWREAIDPVWLGIRHADFAICAGTEAEHHPLIGPATTILRTCAPDVFRMAEIKPDSPFQQPYAVFLDEAIEKPHADYETLERIPPDARLYRRELDQCLRECTESLQLPIITAYQDRQETPNLVFHACYVLAHSSTAISFAVLWNKPIRIIIPSCLKGRPEGRNAQAMNRALTQGYQDYITRYLGTPEAMKQRLTPFQLLQQAGYA